MCSPRRAAPTLAAATDISAFNVGITVGPWLGGTALSAGYPTVAWLGAGLGVIALGVVVVSMRNNKVLTP